LLFINISEAKLIGLVTKHLGKQTGFKCFDLFISV